MEIDEVRSGADRVVKNEDLGRHRRAAQPTARGNSQEGEETGLVDQAQHEAKVNPARARKGAKASGAFRMGPKSGSWGKQAGAASRRLVDIQRGALNGTRWLPRGRRLRRRIPDCALRSQCLVDCFPYLDFGSAAAYLRLTTETTIVYDKGPSPTSMDVDVLDNSVLDASIHHRKVSERGGAGTRYKDHPLHREWQRSFTIWCKPHASGRAGVPSAPG